jgi:hypothetical protein
MAKSGKRSGKGKSKGDVGSTVPPASEPGDRKLGRLERELADARSLESKRSRQLAEAQAAISSLTARIAARSDTSTTGGQAAQSAPAARTKPAAKPAARAKTAPTTKPAAAPAGAATTRPRRARSTKQSDTGPAGGSPEASG